MLPFRTPLALALAVALASLAWGGDERSRTSAVVELVVSGSAATRVDCFALVPHRTQAERESASAVDALASGEARILGVARWVRDRGARVEVEHELFGIDTRVLHVERRPEDAGGERAPELVWRELRRRSGRTVSLVRDPASGGWTSTEWNGGSRAVRRTLTAGEGARLPLELVEACRAGTAPASARVFDPLGHRIEELAIERRQALVHGVPWTRVLWTRDDGTLAGEWWFAGAELVAYRYQRGGPVALRVPAAELERVRAARHAQVAAAEAAASAAR